MGGLPADVRGARVRSSGAKIQKSRKVNFRWVTDEAERAAGRVEEHFNKLLLAVIDQTLDSNVPFLPEQKKAFNLLQKSLASGQQPALNGC